MNASLSDATGILLAAFIGVPVVVLPGYALGLATGVLGFRDLATGPRLLCAALLGIGLLPFLASALAGITGVPATALIALGVGLATLVAVAKDLRARIDAPACALMALWLAVLAYALIDIDTGDALLQPIGVIDLVKHASLTRSIVESGVPPLDPFFARPERVSYYYYFYTLCALVDWLGGPWVDGRAAFGGLAFWTGIGLVGLIDRLLAASGLVVGVAAGRVRTACLLLLPAGGLDILLVLKMRLVDGMWAPVPEWLSEQVLWWPGSLIWVPHHVAAALAGWLGLLVLAEAADAGGGSSADGAPPRRRTQAAVTVAGIAFAACAGLSVWVCLGALAAAGLWMALLVAGRRCGDAARLASAGLLAVILAAPYLVGILSNRDVGKPAIVFEIRRFHPLNGMFEEPTASLARLVLMPLNYYLGFGVFAAGALLFWRLVPRAEAHRSEAGRLLTICAAAGLLVAGFLRSAIIYNDLGWRAVLMAQIAAFVWSAAALARFAAPATAAAEARPARLRLPGLLAGLLVAGYATALYGLVEARAYPRSGVPATAFINARADIDRALRGAYAWAGAHLPGDLVLQQGLGARRVFDFGLYGRQQVAVADRDAILFGASADAVAARLAQVGPIFGEVLTATEVRRRAEQAGIGALVVTAQDAVWADPDAWVWRARTAYAGPLVRIVRVEDIDG